MANNMTLDEQTALTALEARIRTLLPGEYQDCYDGVQPVSMGSASLKYGDDGRVAWNEMWESFCDLAMAGGPPHKGTLLEPGTVADVVAQPDRYKEVVDEICRGIYLVSDLAAKPSTVPGWVDVQGESPAMVDWLVRAITMENVSVRGEGKVICLPCGPHYRIEKEIKNVITVAAKTCHYWSGHMWSGQQRDIQNLFATMELTSPLLRPALATDATASRNAAMAIGNATGLRPSDGHAPGWAGLECPDVRSAIWMMRALVASNILSRREGTTLFVPVNPVADPDGGTVSRALEQIHRFAGARNLL
jgi:sirohydrochlorin cobaltochelatase